MNQHNISLTTIITSSSRNKLLVALWVVIIVCSCKSLQMQREETVLSNPYTAQDDYSDHALHTVTLLNDFYHYNWRFPSEAKELFVFADRYYQYFWKDDEYILASPEMTWLYLLQNYKKHPADYAVIPIDSTIVFVDYKHHIWLTHQFPFSLCATESHQPPAYPYGFCHKILDSDNNVLFALQDSLSAELQAAKLEMKHFCDSVGYTELYSQRLVAEYSLSFGTILLLCDLQDPDTYHILYRIIEKHLKHFVNIHSEVQQLSFYMTIPRKTN